MNPTSARTNLFLIILTIITALTMAGCQGISSGPAKIPTGSTGQTASGLSVQPGSVSFANVAAGTSQTQTETLLNTSASSVTITQAPVTGPGFSISGLSLPLILTAGQSTTFTVTFSPTAVGSASGTIAILSSASNSTLAIPLSGTAASPLQLSLSATPATLDMGSVTVGSSGAGTGSLTASGGDITVTSASSSDSHFVLSGLSLPVTIQQGKSAAFNVIFAPQAAEAAAATLTFVSNAYPSTTAVALTGSGTTAQGQLAITPTTLSLGSVTVGTTGTATGTFAATGADVTITSATSSNARFALNGMTLPATILVGHSAPFTVSYSPKAAGSATATLTFATNANPSSVVANLSGSGTTATGQLGVTPTSLNLGSVAVGANGTGAGSLTATGANVTLTGASSNNAQFAVSGISLPMTIQAGQSVQFTVTFSPQSVGTANAILTFASNGAPPTTTDALSGTGTQAPVHTVNLSWKPSTSTDIVGYNVYRSTYSSACGAYSRLNSVLNHSTTYADSSVTDGMTYCYVTTAVNGSNDESSYSAVVQAKIPAP